MQPVYISLTSTSVSPWRTTNWNATPQQISFAVTSSGGSSWFLEVSLDDPQNVYPQPTSLAAPGSTQPNAFTILTGSSNQFISLTPGSSLFPAPIAAYRFTLNTQSSAGARVTLASVQAGIG